MEKRPPTPPPAPAAAGAEGRTRDVTLLLKAWRGGDAEARDELLAVVYRHLRELARHQAQREHGARTLQPTALVHEAYLRLIDADIDWHNRAHFFAVAGRTMRRVLVDEARSRARLKRGGDKPLCLDDLSSDPATE
ncbi:MAG: ECF-type sigma factor, partial [Acidobacteriota bacterium]